MSYLHYGVDKITWMTQTHSSICHTINEQIPFNALEGDGSHTARRSCLMMMTADCLPVVLGNAEVQKLLICMQVGVVWLMVLLKIPC
jgi:copper oxidase (laccase) domain-containing protein